MNPHEKYVNEAKQEVRTTEINNMFMNVEGEIIELQGHTKDLKVVLDCILAEEETKEPTEQVPIDTPRIRTEMGRRLDKIQNDINTVNGIISNILKRIEL